MPPRTPDFRTPHFETPPCEVTCLSCGFPALVACGSTAPIWIERSTPGRKEPKSYRLRPLREGTSMGELKRRGNVWWIRYCRNGRRYEESSGSDKKGVAINLL